MRLSLLQVRSRAEELRRSVAEVLEALSSGTTLRWEDFLKKFSVINQQVRPGSTVLGAVYCKVRSNRDSFRVFLHCGRNMSED